MTKLLPFLLVLAACTTSPDYLTVDELMQPETCMTCHPKQYNDWTGSMHAYASDDPVFVAMNKRGQSDTAGALGTFCVQCHAPMAVRLGLTTDGSNLATVPKYAKGVTCFFCHSVDQVTADHNNPLVLANDSVLRGELDHPVSNSAHRMTYSTNIDINSLNSSSMCGACHDIVTPAPNNVKLERTYEEWQKSIFAQAVPVSGPPAPLSCNGCHMTTFNDVAAEVNPSSPTRAHGRSDHSFPGVDTALTTWPNQDTQLAAVKFELATAVSAQICVTPENGGQITLRLDDLGGHSLPSGAAQDRRLWPEVIAYDANNNVLFQTGVVPDGMDPESIASTDPNLWLIKDSMVDGNGQPVKYFWQVASETSDLLGTTVTLDPNSPLYDHSQTHAFQATSFFGQIDHVTERVRLLPMPYDTIDDLIAGGELDSAVRANLKPIDLQGSVITWTLATADVDRCIKH